VSTLDLAGLVLVASRTLGLEEAAVLALADLDAAAEVLARVDQTPGGPERQAATLLHGLVRRRVFGARSGEVALLAALQLLALRGREAGDLGPPGAVRELLAGIADGRVGTDELTAWLEGSTTGWRMEMFERFTDRARKVTVDAQAEARRLGHGPYRHRAPAARPPRRAGERRHQGPGRPRALPRRAARRGRAGRRPGRGLAHRAHRLHSPGEEGP